MAVDLTLIRDLQRVGRLRNQAEKRRVYQQRLDATAATARIEPTTPRLTADEIRIQRETAVLYARIVRLEESGKLRWSDYADDWVKRPVFTRTDQNRPPVYTLGEILDRFEKVRRNGKRWTARCPAHDDRSPSLAIAEGSKGWLVKCWAGCGFSDILAAADLEAQRMFIE